MALEDTVKEESGPRGVLAAMRNGKVWYFTVIYFCLQIAVYGVTFYLPQQVAQLTGQKVGLAVGLMAAIPWFFGIFACYFIGKAANTVVRRRVWGTGLFISTGLCIFGSAWAGANHLPALGIIFITLAVCSFLSIGPIAWSYPTAFLTGTAAAAGIGLINSLGQPGRLRRADPAHHGQPGHRLGHRTMGVYALGVLPFLAAVMMFAHAQVQEQGRRAAGEVSRRLTRARLQHSSTESSSRKHAAQPSRPRQPAGSRHRILVGVSTKMYLGYRDSLDWLERAAPRSGHPSGPRGRAGCPVCHPVLPRPARGGPVLAGSPLLLGAQNCGWADGPWTGEVAPSMLAELGVRLVEIGHAERRRHFGEDDAMVALKVRAADDAGLTPLLCVGEATAGRRGRTARWTAEAAGSARRNRRRVRVPPDRGGRRRRLGPRRPPGRGL